MYFNRLNPPGLAGGLGAGFNTNLNPNVPNPRGPIGGPGHGGGFLYQPAGEVRQAFRQDLLSTYGGWAGVRDARWEGQQPVQTQLRDTAAGVRDILSATYGSPYDVQMARRNGELPVMNAVHQFYGLA